MKPKLDNINFSILEWILISIRAIILLNALGWNYLIQKLIIMISPLFPFQIWKRYLSCVVNLIANRIALLALGCLQIETENFKFFSKSDSKITLKSGFIGLGTHKNIIDFLYYSYIFNPMFVRLILIVDKQLKQGKEVEYIKDVNYAPLYFEEALQCAMTNRGFDPIVVRNQNEMKKVKYRKMNMKTLVSESFEELRGAIFILLPGLKHNEHIQIEQAIAFDIYDNQTKFLRSGVGLKVTLDQRPIFQDTFKNQIHFLLHVMSQPKLNHMQVEGIMFRNYKSMYSKWTYRDFMEENFFVMKDRGDVKLRKISYLEYVEEMDRGQKEQVDGAEEKLKKEK